MTAIDQVRAVVGTTPHMSYEQAVRIQEIINKYDVRNCLELGFAHGVGSAYIAAVLKSRGTGRLQCVDNLTARRRQPDIHFFINKLGLQGYIDVYCQESSYNWFLLRELEKHRQPYLDFCYVDGAHTWADDGFAFFLVEKLLRPNGIIIFDDLDWSYETSPTLRDKDWVKKLPEEERKTAQVRKIWDLLVLPHPAFGDFIEEGGWGIARKLMR